MTGRIAHLLCMWAVFASFVGTAEADLVGHWKLDEGSGTLAADASGNQYDGILAGAMEWVEGKYGGALSFSSNSFVELSDHAAELSTMSDYTVAFWVTGYDSESGQVAWSWSNGTNTYRIQLELHEGKIAHGQKNGGGWQGAYSDVLDWDPGEWYHMVFQREGEFRRGYRDGVELLNSNASAGVGPADLGVTPNNVRIGALHSAQFFGGDLDDVRLYDNVLSEGEILDVMLGDFELASNVGPADGAVDVLRDAVLSWAPGSLAETHDVYLGTVLEDVSQASRADSLGVLVSEGQSETTCDPEGLLEFGQTYYWRVDEVNGAPDYTIYTGDVWSFTVEPVAYPIANITAMSPTTTSGDPNSTIDDSGLDAEGQHSTLETDMWAGAPIDSEPVYIQYEFDTIYKLYEVQVWNYNFSFESLFGLGFKDVTITYSENGSDWTVLKDVQFNQGTGLVTYTANTFVDLEGVAAKYVRLTANSGYSTMGQFGLSEVRFLHTPVAARQPQPADGATDVAIDTVLTWRAGREAASHDVSFGTDPSASGLVDTVNTNSYVPGTLDLATAYYWRIDEVNETEAVSQWPGNVWGFTTQAYLVIDDFESYTDEAGNYIYDHWRDGYGTTTNGAQVGHDTEPYAEKKIVHEGRQSMPLIYNNTGPTRAEAVHTFDAQDWTASGIQSLSLYFYGVAGNDGQLYVKINDIRVDYDGEAADITVPVWQVWNVDLSSVGGLANVTTLTIGLEGAGATGVLYIDDVRLYPKLPEYITPIEPDAASLVACYAFEGNVNDSSGHGCHGTEEGGPTYGAGVDGQGITLDGFDDYVVVGSVGISGAAPRTIAGWAKADTEAIVNYTNVFGFTSTSPLTHASFDMNKVLDQYRMHVYNWEGDIMPVDLEWHHLAGTYDGTTIAWYGDGRLIGTVDEVLDTQDNVQMGKRAHNAGGNFPGSLDDVCIYDRALSPAEIAWLAGRRVPTQKPF